MLLQSGTGAKTFFLCYRGESWNSPKTFLCLKPSLYHKLVNTINRSVRFSESPVCFILPLFYKCWSERKLLTQYLKWCNSRGGSRAAATSKMERFVIIVNGFQPLPIITKCSFLDVAAALDPPLSLSASFHFVTSAPMFYYISNFKKVKQKIHTHHHQDEKFSLWLGLTLRYKNPPEDIIWNIVLRV